LLIFTHIADYATADALLTPMPRFRRHLMPPLRCQADDEDAITLFSPYAITLLSHIHIAYTDSAIFLHIIAFFFFFHIRLSGFH